MHGNNKQLIKKWMFVDVDGVSYNFTTKHATELRYELRYELIHSEISVLMLRGHAETFLALASL